MFFLCKKTIQYTDSTSVSSDIISITIIPLYYYARIVTVPHDTLTSASCIYDSVGMLVAIIIMCVG